MQHTSINGEEKFLNGYFCFIFWSLINFHNTVNFPNKPIASKKSDSSCNKIRCQKSPLLIWFTIKLTCEEEKAEYHDASVAKIQESWSWVFNIQLKSYIINKVSFQVLILIYLGKEVMYAINSKVESCESTGQKTSPPPVVILEDNNTLKRDSFFILMINLTSAHRWK